MSIVLLNSSPARETLPFTLQDVRATIPTHCFIPSVSRSLAYFFADLTIILGLGSLAYWLDAWWFYPPYWIAQGTMLWALFVVGHDCGHGSFSPYGWLNSLIGHLCHTPLLARGGAVVDKLRTVPARSVSGYSHPRQDVV